MDVSKGKIGRNDNYFPDGVELPLFGYSCNVFSGMSVLKKDILDLCRFHKRMNATGGAKRRRSSVASGTTSILDISKALERVLLRREVTSVMAVCIEHEGRWHVTTHFEWVEKEESGSEDVDDESGSEVSMVSDVNYVNYVDEHRDPVAFVIERPTFATFQAELTRRLSVVD